MRTPTRAKAAAPPVKNEWISKIQRWQDATPMKKWRASCEKIRDLYRYEDSETSKTRRYQLLWSNMETMKGATYAKPPHAQVERRFRDKDDTARQAVTMIERGINFTLDAEGYDTVFKQVRDDFLLDARGQARVIYEPVMEAVAMPDDGLDVADVEGPQAAAQSEVEEAEALEGGGDNEAAEGSGEPDEILTFERVKLKYLHPADFVHDPARTWEEVKVCAFRSFLDRDELRKRFKGKTADGRAIADLITLDAKGETPGDKNQPGETGEEKGTIWEIWDKTNNRVLWAAVGYPEILEEGKPYLKFEHFFPCPKPAYGTITNDSLAPRPDYVFYQDQAEEINALTARIAALQDSLKIIGFYPGGPKGEGVPEIEKAVKPGVENRMIAVAGWQNFADKGGGKAPIVFLPVAEVAQVLEGCVKLRQQLIEDVNSIYGLTDIMRGAGDPSETATAQHIKSQFGGLRIRTRQEELARFCRDIIRLVGEVLANHFQPETLMAMANMPLPSDAEILAQVQAAQQAQAMQQALAAAQQQAGPPSPMLGHNGGPPMAAPPQAPPPQPVGPM